MTPVTPKKREMLHIDEWVSRPVLSQTREAYAKWFFLHARTPAWMQDAFHPFTKDLKLFCTYGGKTYRVTGASRLGDVWLAEDMTRECGYDLRIDVADCSDWRPHPNAVWKMNDSLERPTTKGNWIMPEGIPPVW